MSGGQRQRLTLARALLRRPALLILDEPTSHIDLEAEAHFQRSVTGLRKQTDMTILIVAHRLSTIRDADMIVVLENGRITGVGSHGQLAAGENWYARAQGNQRGKSKLKGAMA